MLALGDNQYDRGELAEYQGPTGYRASWGRLKAMTYPTPGNHEYLDPAGGAAGYWTGTRYRDDDHYGVVKVTLRPASWSSGFHCTDGRVGDRAAAGCWR